MLCVLFEGPPGALTCKTCGVAGPECRDERTGRAAQQDRTGRFEAGSSAAKRFSSRQRRTSCRRSTSGRSRCGAGTTSSLGRDTAAAPSPTASPSPSSAPRFSPRCGGRPAGPRSTRSLTSLSAPWVLYGATKPTGAVKCRTAVGHPRPDRRALMTGRGVPAPPNQPARPSPSPEPARRTTPDSPRRTPRFSARATGRPTAAAIGRARITAGFADGYTGIATGYSVASAATDVGVGLTRLDGQGRCGVRPPCSPACGRWFRSWRG